MGLNWFLVVAFTMLVMGCKSENSEVQSQSVVIEEPEEAASVRQGFSVSKGIQTDVLTQRIEVINDVGALNEFWLSVPSMSGSMPIFDETTETMVAIISDAESCGYSPVVTAVKESEASVIVSMLNNPSNIPENAVCDPLSFEYFAYNLVSIEKSTKPVSIVFESLSSLSCEVPIELLGDETDRMYFKVKSTESASEIAEEYASIFGAGFSLYRVFDSSGLVVAEMQDTVLLMLRCDDRIESIGYDVPVGLAS